MIGRFRLFSRSGVKDRRQESSEKDLVQKAAPKLVGIKKRSRAFFIYENAQAAAERVEEGLRMVQTRS